MSSGTIIASANFNPESSLPDLDEGEEYPELKRWSDIAALQLQIAADPDYSIDADTLARTNFSSSPVLPIMNNLTYIVRSSIENPHTNAIIHELIQYHTGTPCSINIHDTGCPPCCQALAWPGWTFAIDSDDALALLGTPNGSGVAWLLTQHVELFGRKMVGKVTLWCDVETAPERPNLLFWIEDEEGVKEVEEGPAVGEEAGEDAESVEGYFDVDEYRRFCEGA